MQRVIVMTFLILCSNLIFGQFLFAENIEISPKEYGPNLEQINTIVRENYSHLENKNINIDSLHTVFQSKLSGMESKEEYFKCLMHYFSELRNSHTTIFLREYGIKGTAKLIENRLFIKKVDAPEFLAIKASANDEIIEIDGVPALQWLNMQRKLVSASTKEHELSKTLWKVFNNEFKVARTYVVKTQDGIKTVQTKIENPTEYGYTYPRDMPTCTKKEVNESTGYISINTMTGNVLDEFEMAYGELCKMPNLIIDLRENYGGDSGLSEYIARFLIQTKQKACVSGSKLKPKKNNYTGKLFVLIGTNTGSAAESFAIDLLESENAILIGSPTAGDTGNRPANFTTDYGVSFRIPTRKIPQVSNNNFPMEGIGVPPKFIVKQTVEDFNKGLDTVLEYTLNYILNSK